MHCAKSLTLYDAIGETMIGTLENRNARAAYLEHIRRCSVCQDHYDGLFEWAREVDRQRQQTGSVSTETEEE
jgi:hypothetical protein